MAIPAWAGQPFRDFIDTHDRFHTVYNLTVCGLGMIIHRAHQMEELTAEVQELGGEVGDGDALANAKAMAELAKREVDGGYPTLHEQQTVALWSSLEGLTEEFLGAWILNEPSAMQLGEIRKIKVSVSDYESLQGSEKALYLVRELERSVKASFRHGSDKFEALLAVFGLSGEVKPEVKHVLLELESARNVLLHRRGVIDVRFHEICPWLSFEIGQRLTIDKDLFERYHDGVFEYARVLLGRVRAKSATTDKGAT